MSAKTPRLKSSPLDSIDEAFHLVRRMPLGILMFYYLGAIPFVVVFLYFWADMSQGPLAPQRVVEASLGVAAAYIWMKFWQAIHAGRVRDWIAGDEGKKWTAGRAWQLLVAQASIQPFGLLLKPLSAIVPFFFVPVFSFFSMVTVEGTRHEGVWKLLSRAMSQCLFRGRELYQIVLLLALFAVFVLINFLTLIVFVPFLLQLLFAIDTPFMRTGWSPWNSTLFISGLALTYLGLDPLFKAIFVLRSYYSDARSTGEDLRVDLNRVRKPRSATASAMPLLLLACLLGGTFSHVPAMAGEKSAPEGVETSISVEQLDERIERVLSQREYVWRLPKPPMEEEGDPGLFRRFVTAIGEVFKDIWTRAGRAAERAIEWLFNLLFRGAQDRASTQGMRNLSQGLQVLIFGLGAVLIGLTCFILWQAWKRKKRVETGAAGAALQPRPDLEDENVAADALPADEWTRMGMEHKAKLEFRLALRAFYLASLAALSKQQLLLLAKAKSNREYQAELNRRAHDQAGRVEAFRANCGLYEQAWYGMYPVDGDTLARFEINQERIIRHEEIVAH